MKKLFSLCVEEYGVKITLVAELLPAVSASFDLLEGLDDAESSDVCNAAFQASAAPLAALVSQALEQVSGHGYQCRAAVLSSRPSLVAPEKEISAEKSGL